MLPGSATPLQLPRGHVCTDLMPTLPTPVSVLYQSTIGA